MKGLRHPPKILVAMSTTDKPSNFLEQIIEKDLADGVVTSIHTRFPPEPNGFLHVGHATSICLNFGLAERFGGQCNLRFDDTNPEKEEQVYVDSIQEDIKWLGFQWSGKVKYASSYFDTFYNWAIHLIKEGKAYVDHQDAESMSKNRGDFKKQGVETEDRKRSVDGNLAEFEKMRAGEYDEGICSLRAKIDLQNPNMNMRDPVLYRIRKKPIIRPVINGVSTQAMTLLMVRKTPLKALLILSVRWNFRITVHCMSGLLKTCRYRISRVSMSLPVPTLTTHSPASAS